MDELLNRGRITVVPTRLDDTDVAEMIDEVQQEYVRRYGDMDLTPLDVAEFLPPHGVILKAVRNGDAVGMGGWRVHETGADAVGLLPGDAEIKRMYVRDVARGKGVARALLAAIETSASDGGRKRLVLETGMRQPEAIGLYTSSGYLPLVPKFGLYRDEDLSVCMVKQLRG